MANGSLSTMTRGEGGVREALVRDDVVDCIVALPGKLFYTTGIPVCLWFLDRNKASAEERDRRGETLFIDARHMGQNVSRTQIELTEAEINRITGSYHTWRGQRDAGDYRDEPGSRKAATVAEIEAAGMFLSPGRYVGAPDEEEAAVLHAGVGQPPRARSASSTARTPTTLRRARRVWWSATTTP